MNQLTTKLKIIICALTLITLFGCAALKLDVDVYKGPLANHEDVQMEQLAVMAIGAEPLLSELEEKLRFQLRVEKSKCSGDKELNNRTISCLNRIISIKSDISNIQGVLSLYQDDQYASISKRLKSILTKAKINLSQYKEYENIVEQEGSASPPSNENILQNPNYINGRNKLADLWHNAIEGLILIKSFKGNNNTRAINEVSKALVNLTQPQHLAVALDIDSPPFTKLKEEIETVTRMAGWTMEDVWGQVDWKTPDNIYVRANNILQLAFRYWTPEQLRLFREVNDRIRQKKSTNTIVARQINLKASEKTAYLTHAFIKFGLVRGLSLTSDTLGSFNLDSMLAIDQRELVPDSFNYEDLGLFQQGRLKDGIESLINKYLTTRDVADVRDNNNDQLRSDLEFHRRRLMESLVRFAQKLLFVANNDELLTDGDQHGLDQYVLTLQSIGNSILNQADELKHRKSHDQKLADGKRTEQLAFAEVFNRSPSKVLNDIILSIQSKINDNKTKKSQFDGIIKEKGIAVESTKKIIENNEEKLKELTINRNNQTTRLEKTKDDEKGVIASYRTITGHMEKIDDTFDNVIDTYIAKDQTDLLDTLKIPFPDDQQINTTTFKTAMVKWLSETRPKDLPGTAAHAPVKKRWQLSADFFNSSKMFEAMSDDSVSNFIDKTKTKVTLIYNNAKKVIKTQKTDLRTITDNFTSTTEENATLAKRFDTLTNDITTLTAEKEENTNQNTVLINASATVKGLIGDVIQRIGTDSLLNKSPSETKEALLAVLSDKLDAATDSNAKLKLTHAQNVIASISVAIDAGDFISKAQNNDRPELNQKDVLDDLIKLLRYEKMRKTTIPDNEQAVAAIDAALKVAYQQRSGMSYIRPASAFLRSSFAATELQQDPRLGWKNLLEREDIDEHEQKRLKILSNIDKQFWQNINSVTVRGGGNINYAVVKDDIGNWYVKGYSNDVGPIVSSVHNLAMFAAGNKLGENLVRRAELKAKVEGDDANQNEKDEYEKLIKNGPGGLNSPLATLFSKHNQEYADKTEVHRQLLLTGITGIEVKISAAWDTVVKGDKSQTFLKTQNETLEKVSESLEESQKTLENVKKNEENKDPIVNQYQQSNAIIQVLSDVRRYRDQLILAIKGQNNQYEGTYQSTVVEEKKALEKSKNTYDEAKVKVDKLNTDLKEKEIELKQLEVTTITDDQRINHENKTKQLQVVIDSLKADIDKEKLDDKENTYTNAQETLQQVTLELTQAKANIEGINSQTDIIIKNLLINTINKRKVLIDKFETAVTFIGEAEE